MRVEQSTTTVVETTVDKVDALAIYAELHGVGIFAGLREEDAACLGEVEVIRSPAGSVLNRNLDEESALWCAVKGEVRGYKKEADGSNGYYLNFSAGESFGEVPLLTGWKTALVLEVISDTTLIGFPEESFWKLMAACPVVRSGVIENMGRRLQNYQAFAVHREKLISLGTLAAGLMHELNNPGTAAKRSATQLRENLVQLQQISLRFCEMPLADEQIECMKDLQTRAMGDEKPKARNTIDQADAEECLAEWLDETGVSNGWKMAPTLTAIGLTQRELECARESFEGASFSDALSWVVSLVSSMQLVGTIEESITRISELVTAVKKYSYNDTNAAAHPVDVHDGLMSTITILGHKFRPKDLKIDRQFASKLPMVQSCGSGLAQVWTNLLDNAVDASPESGTIHIRTWVEEGNVCVGIADEGPGIPKEHQERIFEAFFTTKPVGVGTGLGLEIARRIVVGSYDGQIGFTTEPGKTEFIVRIPVAV